MNSPTVKRYGDPQRTIRVSDDIWDAAGARAEAEGTPLSAVIREWLEDYAAGGADRRPPRIRLSAAERKAARDAVAEYVGGMVDDMLAAVNSQR